jgi:succinate dehydrogenase/fumarate reductase flavoprotein subunit
MVEYTRKEYSTDVLVIGGGMAAVFAATRAIKNGAKVTLVDKGSVGRSGQSPFASGMTIFDESTGADRATWHKNMAYNAENLNNPAYLDVFMDYSKGIYDDLLSWGATESGFGAVLRKQVIDQGVEVIERTMITSLLENNGKIAGAIGFKLDNEEAVIIKAKAVILCTGAGGFKPCGFQIGSLTFDGDAMAYRIGAKISGKEFVDTHDTSAATPAYCAGTPQQRNWSLGLPEATDGPLEGGGMALDLTSFHSAHEGNIPVTMQGGAPPSSDGDSQGGPPSADGDSQGGPPSADGDSQGGPPSSEGEGQEDSGESGMIGGASAGLSVHKAEGLFPADNKCRTNIEGLFAAGDCLSSMLVGPIYNGVVGFALAGSATQGALAGETSAEYIKNTQIPNISDDKINAAITEMFEPLNNEKGYAPSWVEHLIQGTLIPYYVLYIKNEDRLNSALTNIEFYRDHFAVKLRATDLHSLRKAHEVKNMLLNAEMKLKSSLFRTESRGNHYREDYPDSNDNDWLAWVVMQKGDDGNMKLEKFLRKDFEKLVV